MSGVSACGHLGDRPKLTLSRDSPSRSRLARITKAIHDATGYKLYLTKNATTAERFRQIRAMIAELEMDGDWVSDPCSRGQNLLASADRRPSRLSRSSSSLASRSSVVTSRTRGSWSARPRLRSRP